MPSNAAFQQQQQAAGTGSESCSPADQELQELQRRVAERNTECQRLEEQVAKVEAEKEATTEACRAGVGAAKAQLQRLKSELEAARRVSVRPPAESGTQATDAEVEVGEIGAAQADPPPGYAPRNHAEMEDAKTRCKALDLEARSLRHEVARWRHQAEQLEAERPKQEELIVKLKAEYTHTLDVLDSTRNAVRHQEVDRAMRRKGRAVSAVAGGAVPEGGGPPSEEADSNCMPLHGGGHGSIEALAERNVREKTEQRIGHLQGKVQQLSDTCGAQLLLIQRLEKQLLREGGALEEKEMHLAGETQCQLRLKSDLRRRSDNAVARALGMALPGAPPPEPRLAPAAPGLCPDGRQEQQVLA